MSIKKSTQYDQILEWNDIDVTKRQIIKEVFTSYWKDELFASLDDHRDGLKFIIDIFNDPVLLLSELAHAKVIEYEAKYCNLFPLESNYVTITHVDWSRFQHLIDEDVFKSENVNQKLQEIFGQVNENKEKKRVRKIIL